MKYPQYQHTKEFKEGYDAFLSELSLKDNPYERGSIKYCSWNDGFVSAKWEYEH